jgi:glycine betaine/proline transport system ATP-binding protein
LSAVSDIVLRNVTKIFGPTPLRVLDQLRAGVTKEALLAQTGHTIGVRDVSLTIKAGSCFVVMGLSGSGKSTLLRHLNRLIEPTAGEILFEGEDILRLPPEALRRFRRDRTSMVFQHFALFPHKTVLENAAYGLNLQARGAAERRANLERARRWIERVGLAGYEAQYPGQLSGGMQQRVGLARALATEAEVMLMDEAFSALDPLIRREMQDTLLRLQAELHRTIVFITHDLDEALRLGDRIAIMNDGAIEQVGRPEEILQRPANAYVTRFVADVNRGRVLTAGALCLKAIVAREGDTPESVLARLRDQPLPIAYLADAAGRLAGALSASTLRGAPRGTTLRALVQPVPSAPRSMVLERVLPITLESDFPVAVVDDDACVVGMLPKDRIIAALAAQLAPVEAAPRA